MCQAYKHSWYKQLQHSRLQNQEVVTRCFLTLENSNRDLRTRRCALRVGAASRVWKQFHKEQNVLPGLRPQLIAIIEKQNKYTEGVVFNMQQLPAKVFSFVSGVVL